MLYTCIIEDMHGEEGETVLLTAMGDTPENSESEMYDKPEDETILYAAYRSNVHELSTLISEDPERAWKVYKPSGDTLIHRVTSGGYPNCVEAAKFILNNWKGIGINWQNRKGWTPLHNACHHSQQAKLVDLLLQRGSDATITNEDGENPFQLIVKCNTPEAIQIAELLLTNNFELIKSKSHSGENIVESLVKHSALNMLEFLWTKFKDDANSVFGSQLVDSGKEGPSLWLAVQKGDGPITVDCVQYLLDILPAEAVNMKGKDGNTALHLAAKHCYVNILKALVSSPKTNVFEQNTMGETCLHVLTQVSGKYSNPLLSLETLFKESQQLRNNEAEKRRLILSGNVMFKTDSPLMVAVKNRTTKVAELLVKEHGNKEALAKRSDGLLAAIYEKTPEAVEPLLDKCITFLPSASEDDLETIKVDMGPITGFEGSDIRNESKIMHGIFNATVKQQRKILSHPVVTIFLSEKWKKLQLLTFAYIALYVIWLLLYSCLCYELYPPNCPSNATETLSDQTGIMDLRIFRSLGFQKRLEQESCSFNTTMARLFALILFIYTPMFGFQEAIKLNVLKFDWKTYLLNPVTILQWIRHLVVVINIIPAFMAPANIPYWQYHLGVAIFTFAWLMLLNDMANIPAFAILLSILLVTVKNFAKFLLFVGFPILVAFVPALCRYVAKDNQFLYLPFGIIKNFMLMTGEVEYKETFYSEEGPDLTSYAIVGQFIIVIAVFGFGLVLANVLTSVAVKEFQDLVKDAEYKTAVMQLKSIHFIDSLVVWLNSIPSTYSLSEKLAKWNHLDFGGVTRTIENMKTEGFPEELMSSIKKIAVQEKVVVNADGNKSIKKAFG